MRIKQEKTQTHHILKTLITTAKIKLIFSLVGPYSNNLECVVYEKTHLLSLPSDE